VLVKPFGRAALRDTLVRLLHPTARAPATPLPAAFARGWAESRLRAAHTGRRVLLAEDNPINREVAEELLRSVGLEVQTAENGEQAVQLALDPDKHRAPDLILMDMQMPVMDGLEATRLIRRRAGPGMPIVAITANAFDEDRQACLAAGMNDHLTKPFDSEALYATLLRWLPPTPSALG
jgi:CheY-like chemotaxis protein